MTELAAMVTAGMGGMVGMAGALGYGFKLMVDILGKQLTAQNEVIHGLETGISADLKAHRDDCRKCMEERDYGK